MVKSVFHLNGALFQFCFIQIPSWSFFSQNFAATILPSLESLLLSRSLLKFCLAFTDDVFLTLTALIIFCLVSHSYHTLNLGLDFIYIHLGYTVLPEFMNLCFSNQCWKLLLLQILPLHLLYSLLLVLLAFIIFPSTSLI